MKPRILFALALVFTLAQAPSRAATSTTAALAPIPKELAADFSKQINSEMAAAYLYLAMASHFRNRSLDGIAKFFTVHFYEELNHARKMIDFVNDRAGNVSFPAVPEAHVKIEKSVDAFVSALDHEVQQTAKIHVLFEKAKSMKAYDAEVFLHYFVDEQVEEEALFMLLVDKLKLIGDSPEGLLALDRELGNRPLPKIEL